MEPLWSYLSFSLVLLDPIFRFLWFAICKRIKTIHNFTNGLSEIGYVRLSFSLSLFLSTPLLLLLPIQLQYINGSTWIFAFLGYFLAIIFVFTFLLPILHYSKSASFYQYFEDRFNSPILRRLIAGIFVLEAILYCALLLTLSSFYAHALFPLHLWLICIILGIFSLVGVLIGGHGASIDGNCVVFLFGPLLCLCSLFGKHLWNYFHLPYTNRSTLLVIREPKMEMDPFSPYPDPFLVLIGSFFFALHLLCSNQITFQHYQSATTTKRARYCIILTALWITVISGLTFVWGLIFRQYMKSTCVQLHSDIFGKLLQVIDALFHKFYPLSGFLWSTFVWSAVCSVGTSMLSMTTVIWEDFMRSRLHNSKDKRQLIIFRIVLVFVCLLTTTLAAGFLNLRPDFWTIVQKLLILLGSLTAPITAVFLAGVFLPCANSKGAVSALLIGISFNIGLGFLHEKAYDRLLNKPFVFSQDDLNCDQNVIENATWTSTMLLIDENSTNIISTELTLFQGYNGTLVQAIVDSENNQTSNLGVQNGLPKIFKVSLLLHPAIGFVLTFLIVTIVSLLTGSQDVYIMDWNLVFFTCNDCVERVQFDGSAGRFRRNRQPFAPSESFRYAHHGPLPDTSYHNPKVKHYLEKENKR